MNIVQFRNRVAITAVLVALVLSGASCKKSADTHSTPLPPATTKTAPAGPVELKLKWFPGQRIVQTLDVRHTAEISGAGMPSPMKQDMDMGQTFAISVLKDLPDGGHDVEMEFLSAKMRMTMGGRSLIDYDSSHKSSGAATNPAAATFQNLIGAKIRFFLNASNQVEAVMGVDELQKRMASGSKNDPAGVLKSMLSEDYFRQMMEHNRGLPPKPVVPGDSWPVHQEITMGDLGKMDMDFTYTLKDWEKRGERYCARIGFDGIIKSKLNQIPSAPGMTIDIKDGKSSGETWFDLDFGMFVDTTMNQEINMLMTVPIPQQRGRPNAPKSQTVTNIITQAITIKMEPPK